MLKKLFLLIIGLWINTCSFAQNYSVTFQTNVGNPGGLNTEADNATSGWNNIILGNQLMNTWSTTVSIPFPFLFYGQSVTDFTVSQNGLVSFDVFVGTPSGLDNQTLPSTEVGNLTICAFWDEFTYNPPTASNSVISYKVFGNAPNRQLWIKWSNFEIGNNSTTATWACVLEEGTNKIYVVDMNIFSGSNLSATVGIQFDNSKGICYNNSNFVGFDNIGSTSAADNDVYVFEPLYDEDAKLESFDNPISPFAMGTHPVRVTLRNLGMNTLTSATIQWEVNGVLQTPYAWTGSLISLDFQDNITLGNYNFSSAGPYTIKAWVENPNGLPDEQPLNDTITKTFYPALVGTYTIGGTSADFPNFVAAAQALNNGGIIGPVTFNVIPSQGPYSGQVYLKSIQGSSATNTITFNGSTNKDTILFAASLSNNPATLLIDSCQYINFNNLTFLTTGSAYGIAVKITNQSQNIAFNNCRIITNTTSTTADFAAFCVIGNDFNANGNFGQNISIQNSEISGGYYNIYYKGSPSPYLNIGNFSNNSLQNAYMKAIYAEYGQELTIENNTIFLRTNAASASIGIELKNIDKFFVLKNTIQRAKEIGIKIDNGNYQNGSPTIRAKIINNMVGGGFTSANSRGIQLINSSNQNIDIYHNSVSIVGVNGRALDISGGQGIDVQNNSFAVFNSTAGYALYISSNSIVSNVNYNNYFTQNSSNFINIGTSYTPSNYVGGGGFNANSKHGDPGYANNQTNLHARRSQLNDSATPLGVTEDIDGDSRPMPPGLVPDIGADEFNPPAADLGVSNIQLPLDYSCGKTNDTIIVTIKNYGIAAQSNIPVRTEVFGAGNQTFNNTVPGPLNPNETASIIITNFNTNLTGTFYVRSYTLFSQDSIYENDTLQKFVTMLKTPSISGQNVLVCDSGSAVLSVTPEPNAQYSWYNAPNGTLLGTGSSFTTPTVYLTTSFFVQGVNKVSSHVGPQDTTLGSGAFTGTFTTGTTFNVYRTITLDTVVVYSSNTGTAVINLKNSSNTILNTINFDITAPGRHEIPLDFVVSPGTNYKLDLQGSTSSLRLYQNNSGALYPYSVNNVFEITGNTANQNARYYYFYDWVITINSCESNFVPITVIVGQSPQVNLPTAVTACDTAFLNASVPGINNPSQYVWNTGFVGPNYNITQSGQYFVQVTGNNGCIKNDTVQVTILNSASINLGNDTTLACGDSLVLDAGIGASYEWSTGDTSHSIVVYSSGTYIVRVFQGFCESRDTITVNFTSSFTLGNDTTLNCGETLQLTSNVTADAYLWSDGSTNSTLSVSQSGTYWLEITKGGCILRDTVVVTFPSVYDLGWAADTAACNALTLDATVPNASSYLWSDGSTNATLNVSQSGTYFVSIQTLNGCTYQDTINVTINTSVEDVQIQVSDTVGQNQTMNVSPSVLNGGYSYTWNFGAGATPATATGPGPHTVAWDTTGDITIQLITTNGCGSDTTTKIIHIKPVSIEEAWKASLRIYPNPFSDHISIQNPLKLPISLTIFNIQGQKISTYNIQNEVFYIQTHNWLPGTYIIQLQKEHDLIVLKMVKP